ncbi:hypothetical protein DOY81_009365 [Sarcophaga bullata]|nr:hypothetical protein DOY81_009365 [Sarcophaga bullata]
MALCDANYTFTVVDIGAYDSQSDGGDLNSSKLGMFLKSSNLNFPEATILSSSDV